MIMTPVVVGGSGVGEVWGGCVEHVVKSTTPIVDSYTGVEGKGGDKRVVWGEEWGLGKVLQCTVTEAVIGHNGGELGAQVGGGLCLLISCPVCEVKITTNNVVGVGL
jgi:hypothetical protein